MEEAKRVFAEFLPKEEEGKGMTIVTGCRLLRGFVGDEAEKEKWVGKKVEEFVKRTERVAEAAVHAPQEVYTAYVKSQQREWGFLQRVREAREEQFDPLKAAIRDRLLPALLFGRPRDSPPTAVEQWMRKVSALPVRLGGMGIDNPKTEGREARATSQAATRELIRAIQEGREVEEEKQLGKRKRRKEGGPQRAQPEEEGGREREMGEGERNGSSGGDGGAEESSQRRKGKATLGMAQCGPMRSGRHAP
uniref:Uncharacterized protein n=1 Tax=Chromera velia CCMP2878 TaxID=1169474 RepID=A0A0G4FNS7_9ALVE|eukprot:Cvel_17808.t1-p1 / transcript=Cvel_17808.t1 / gene=Cvel_17808 / organism=Chromera_velia_CCMP2878 / gene_product=hypothetical protein / transcript_product=hypothetical protein / location=Cvel_scaffold1442:27486-28229(-) / protein_length=248 / sequence_SO=supercontig / SO=protein_coding / is_pseudo=false